jgi:hypothetical protein
VECGSVSERAEHKCLAQLGRAYQLQYIEIGVLQRVEPHALLLRDMFRDHVPKLFNQRQLSIFWIEVTVQNELCKFYFFGKGSDK